MFRTPSIALLALLTTTGSPRAPTDIDLTAPTDSLAAEGTDGQAEVVVVRPTVMGFAVSLGIEINGMDLGSIRSRGYVLHQVPPGQVEVVARPERDCRATFAVEADHRYNLEASPKPGWWFAHAQLELLDPEAGKTAVLDCEDQTRCALA